MNGPLTDILPVAGAAQHVPHLPWEERLFDLATEGEW